MEFKTAYRRDTQGPIFFKKTYHVIDIWLTLTEAEELAIIENGLMEMVLWERGAPANSKDIAKDYNLTPATFIFQRQPDSYAFASETEARQYEMIIRGPVMEALQETLAEELKG